MTENLPAREVGAKPTRRYWPQWRTVQHEIAREDAKRAQRRAKHKARRVMRTSL